jgi:hypothetical protein
LKHGNTLNPLGPTFFVGKKLALNKMYTKHLKTRKVWFSNGRFLLEPTIVILDHFWPPSFYCQLKSQQNSPVIQKPNHFVRFGPHVKAVKLAI